MLGRLGTRLGDLHRQGLGWREVGEPAGIASRVYEEGQPPGDEAARLVADHHARGWPGKTVEDKEAEPDEMLLADGRGWPWRPRSRVCCAAMVTDIRPVRRTRLRTVDFLARDGRRLKWVSSYNETDDDGLIAVIWTGRSDMTLWDTATKTGTQRNRSSDLRPPVAKTGSRGPSEKGNACMTTMEPARRQVAVKVAPRETS